MIVSLENRSRVDWRAVSVDGDAWDGAGFLVTQKGTKMNKAFSDIIKFFEDKEWNFTLDEERPLLRTGYSGENGEWNCVTFLERDDGQFTFISFLPGKAPAKLRRTIAELQSRINYRLTTGSLEMDWRDGEILMKTTTVIPDGRLSDEIIDQVLGLNLSATDYYFPVIMKVLYAGIKPSDAIEELDKPEDVKPRFELN